MPRLLAAAPDDVAPVVVLTPVIIGAYTLAEEITVGGVQLHPVEPGDLRPVEGLAGKRRLQRTPVSRSCQASVSPMVKTKTCTSAKSWRTRAR